MNGTRHIAGFTNWLMSVDRLCLSGFLEQYQKQEVQKPQSKMPLHDMVESLPNQGYSRIENAWVELENAKPCAIASLCRKHQRYLANTAQARRASLRINSKQEA
jgi:hypothetical protein